MSSPILNFVFLLFCAILVAHAQTTQTCPRYADGSIIAAPEDLFSTNGVLTVNFTYQTATDQNGNTLFCFTASDGAQSPTLHVNPGDLIVMTVANAVPESADSAVPAMHAAMSNMAKPQATTAAGCGTSAMTATSVNVHFHGTNAPATCHQDEVIATIINSGQSFEYDLQIPADEPPGLYWYHPHVHGISEAAVMGGASGAIVVEGLQDVNSAVAGLPQQILIVRDNLVSGNNGPGAPSRDLSVNYVPVPYPLYPPAQIVTNPEEPQLWSVLNASADTILDLQLSYDGQIQPLRIVALDGVPTGSQDGTTAGATITQTDVLIPPAGRAEFIVTGPASTVTRAILSTLAVNTGVGFNDPARPLATVQVSTAQSGASAGRRTTRRLPQATRRAPKARFAALASVTPSVQRQLYFSETPPGPGSQQFFITVAGRTPTAFSPDNPPAIVTTVGSVEDWTIENQAPQNHEFHIHQIHFLLVEQNGVAVSNGQYLDTIDIPGWSGAGAYPSVTLRMDFREVTPANFVYHCHILNHEDAGMMAIIQVVAAPASLSISKAHAGNFTQGQQGGAYTVTVSNAAGAGPTSGAVTVTETVPTGVTLASMSGSGWTCADVACARSDALEAGSSYPPIAVTVNVAANAAAQLTNQVSVSGGGSATASTADPTTIGPAPAVLPATTANSASFTAAVAPGSIATVFGSDLANGSSTANSTVTLTDASGVAQQCDLFFVSAAQVNFLIPSNAALGPAGLTVQSGDGMISQGNLTLTAVAPGIFTANGVLASALEVVETAGGTQTTTVLVSANASGTLVTSPISLDPSTNTVFLVLYGTGIRGGALTQVSVEAAGQTLVPTYAGAAPGYSGEDQVNVQLPYSLKGTGDAAITVTVAGQQSNTVHIQIQ